MTSPLQGVGRVFRTLKSILNQKVRQGSIYRVDPGFKPPHLDDMPVPHGSWQSHYNAKQSVYNGQLIAGLVMLGSTVTYIYKSERFFFNAFFPPLDEEKPEGLATFNPPPEC